ATFAYCDNAPELIKDADPIGADTSAWSPIGNVTLSKITDAESPALGMETVRRNSPNGQCGVQGSIGLVAVGDVVRIEMGYRVIAGGGMTLYLGPNRDIGLSGFSSATDESIVADVPAKVGGNWRFLLLQNMSARRGEIVLKRLSARIVEHGDASRFPIVTDGNMEQTNGAFFGAYNRARLSKDETVKKAGQRSLHAQSYEDDRPSSMYAGVACNFGVFEAKTTLRVSFDIKVAKGSITPMMTKGAFDKGYPAIGPTDWQHVDIDYETPVRTWYSIIWTRTKDEPFEFWLDNVECVAKNE
ncbi:MAG: hypothetical protein COZ56_20160, partial [Armatimonadetes bacterium CG_4_8_14_3_um_filter_58_9]